MNNGKSLEILAEMAVNSEYFMQVTLDTHGNVLNSDSGIGPTPSLFDQTQKPVSFSDCFLSSDWIKYENNRLKAWKNHHQSFMVELQKINHPSGNLLKTKWEFFFTTGDIGTCIGIGHPLGPIQPYNLQLGEFMENEGSSTELIDNLLEDKLLGFWELFPFEKTNSISSGIALTLGYSKEDLETMGKISWEKHIHPDDFQMLIKELDHHFKTAGSVPFKKEFRLISQRNQTIWVMAYGKAIQWASDGLPQKVQGIILDITEKKKQELWLQEHHHFLRELAYQQSHTLRARVANIMGLIDILSIEQQSVESKRIVDIIKNETTQLDQALKKSIKESVQQKKSMESEDDSSSLDRSTNS